MSAAERERPSDQVVRAAAVDAVKRMRRMWPAFAWGSGRDSAASDYGEGLMSVGDARAIRVGVTNAIRLVGGKFPPSLGDLLEYVRHEARSEPNPIPTAVKNCCPVCREKGNADDVEVRVDPRSRVAFCTAEPSHNWSWRV